MEVVGILLQAKNSQYDMQQQSDGFWIMARLTNAAGFLQDTGEDCSRQHTIAWLVVHGAESMMEIQGTNLVISRWIDVSRYCSTILGQLIDMIIVAIE